MTEQDAACKVCRGPVRHHMNDTGMCPAAPYIADLQKAGDDLAHWLRAWVEQHPEPRPCYSEAALADWDAVTTTPTSDRAHAQEGGG